MGEGDVAEVSEDSCGMYKEGVGGGGLYCAVGMLYEGLKQKVGSHFAH